MRRSACVVEPASWTSTTPVAVPEQGEVETPLIVSGEGKGPIMDANVRILELRHPLDVDLLLSLRPPGWSTYIHLSVYEGLGAPPPTRSSHDEADPNLNRARRQSAHSCWDSAGRWRASTAIAPFFWNLRILMPIPRTRECSTRWGIELMTVRCYTAPIPSFITQLAQPSPKETSR